MTENYKQFEKRKQDHIRLSLLAENQAVELNGFDEISLVHEALPDLDFAEIDISTTRFNNIINKPFIVASMTAGHKDANSINHNLIAACKERNWSMGVGSQRRELTDDNARNEWRTLRKTYEDVSLFSNLGISQVINTPIEKIQEIIDSIVADALIIHCNPLQECIQPEGTPFFKGCWQSLEHLIKVLPVPVVIKETGCGFSVNTLKRLKEIGISAVDVSGAGGTHWGRIEGHRSENSINHKTSIVFKNWGINTIESIKNAHSIMPNYEIWGSGGVRSGLDAAKLFALGVKTVSFAKMMLEGAVESIDKVIELMDSIEYELKVAMFCTGSKTLNDLKEKLCL